MSTSVALLEAADKDGFSMDDSRCPTMKLLSEIKRVAMRWDFGPREAYFCAELSRWKDNECPSFSRMLI